MFLFNRSDDIEVIQLTVITSKHEQQGFQL
jgi:hypothetical protein